MKNIWYSFVVLCIISQNLFSKDYHFDKISADAGFTFNELTSIVEDQNGVIWFGCGNGIYNYNAVKIEHYTTTTRDSGNLLSNYANKLYVDDFHQLWACTSMGFCRFDRSTSSFIPLAIKNQEIIGSEYNANGMVQINDSTYFIIINSRLYRYNAKKEQIERESTSKDNNNAKTRTVLKDQMGTIWAGLMDGSTYQFDHVSNRFTFFSKYRNSIVSTICSDNQFIWIGYDGEGVDKIGRNGNLIQHYGEQEQAPYRLLSDRIRKIIKRGNDDIWVGTYGGINVLNVNYTDAIVDNQFNNLPYKSIYDLLLDSKGGIWIGTWAGGLAYYSDFNYHFQHIKKIPFYSNYSKNIISSFSEDSKGVIWIGTENAGIKSFDQKNEIYQSYDVLDESGNMISIKALALDKNDRIWIGTFSSGLWYKNKTETTFHNVKNDILNETSIYHKLLATDEGIWIGSHGKKLHLYHPDSNTLDEITVDNRPTQSLLSSYVRTMLLDKSENLWLGTDLGVYVRKKNDTSFIAVSDSILRYKTITYSLCEVKPGEIWVGTKDVGILTIDTEKMVIEELKNTFTSNLNEVYNIILDKNNNVWITSNLGILSYNIEKKQTQIFNEKDGVLGRNFNPNACILAKNGKLFFGGSNGFNIVNPATIVQNPFAPKVLLSSLEINNTPYTNYNTEPFSTKYITELDNLTLKHNQNSISLSFTCNNYVKSYNNQFKYRVINYQEDWVNIGNKNNVSFTKIPPGKYTLQVLGANNNGVWSKNPLQLKIHIVPPIWKTTLAYIIYCLLLFIIGYLIIRELYYRASIKKTMVIERFRHEAEEQLFQEKQKFFTNISHEFRTPLTLILSPLNMLEDRFSNDITSSEHLHIIKRNADRLLRLTNEILDFRLIETGKIRLKSEPTDLITICKNTYDCFMYAAVEKEINFLFASKYESLILKIDGNKIEKIVYNLVSNAFKFSSDKSQIILSIDTVTLSKSDYYNSFFTGVEFTGEAVEIRVKDFGRGISTIDMPTIFERFSTKNEMHLAGTGLGLHISQEYIRLHGGNIFVTSTENKETTFVVNIPLIEAVQITKQNLLIQPGSDDFNMKYNAATIEQYEGPVNPDKVILIVEDHLDLRKYLKSILSNKYKVLTANNGTQGYEIAIEVTPHLIISDVMMPGIDGITLTKQLKENSKTNHIPIILLTALTDTKDQINGIAHGADLYLLKPVDEKLLFAHIHRLLEDRKKITQQLVQNSDKNDATKNKNLDKLSFVEKLEFYTSENLQNPNFTVVELAEKLNLSRSSMHRRLKKEMGQSVTEFIRDVRMKRAIDLMKDKKLNLDEIGYYVGFNSHSYFTRSFKKKYGKTPKEFYEDIKADKII